MPDSLRVLFVNPGADVYGSDLQMLESVRALVRSGHEVLLLAADAGPLLDAASAAGAEVRVTPFPVIRRSYLSVTGVSRLTSQVATRFPQMLRYVRGARCDLVYVNTMTIPWWVLAARLAGVPVLCHVHEAEDADALWLRRGMTAPLFLADRVVLNSRTAAGVAHEVCPSLHASSTVVLNGMPDRTQPCVPPPQGERPRLALVGRLSERKSQHVAVAAVDVLLRRGVEVDLELAGTVYPGNEAYERRLRTMVATLGLEERVRFSGYVAPSSTVFDRADIALSLSERESLGNVVLEAQLAGRPVIATRTGGHLETIEDGCTGLHVPVRDPEALAAAVETLIADPARADRLARAGRESARRCFGVERYRDEIVSVVHEVARPHHRRVASDPTPATRAHELSPRHPDVVATTARDGQQSPSTARTPGRSRRHDRRTPA